MLDDQTFQVRTNDQRVIGTAKIDPTNRQIIMTIEPSMFATLRLVIDAEQLKAFTVRLES